MSHFTKYEPSRRHSDVLLILLLLFVLCGGSLLFVIYGADAYAAVNSRRDSTFERTTPLFYAASKIRQSEGSGSVRVENRDGVSALVLTDHDSGQPCETWIYEYEGQLRELYVDQGVPFDPEDGTVLLKHDGLTFALSRTDNGRSMVTLSSQDEKGRSTELTILLRGERS